MRILDFPTVHFETILKSIEITFHQFDLTKCDERTFYISIVISTNNQPVIGDLIYLVDKHDLYGAISLNEKYDRIRAFFKHHFNYDLLYSDEQAIARLMSQSHSFKQCFKQYANRYPKHVQTKFFY